jgi:hypothetical protein
MVIQSETRNDGVFKFFKESSPTNLYSLFGFNLFQFDSFFIWSFDVFDCPHYLPDSFLSVSEAEDVAVSVQVIKFVIAALLDYQDWHTCQHFQIIFDVIMHIIAP